MILYDVGKADTGGLPPVSYTHLDVYKRQVYPRSLRKGVVLMTNFEIISVVVNIIFIIIATIDTVSYTHLDVYKRQQ